MSINKIVEIFESWKIKYNPSHPHTILSSKRIEICNQCEYKSDTLYSKCTICGCALNSKIFSPIKGVCPNGFWDLVDGV